MRLLLMKLKTTMIVMNKCIINQYEMTLWGRIKRVLYQEEKKNEKNDIGQTNN